VFAIDFVKTAFLTRLFSFVKQKCVIERALWAPAEHDCGASP